MSKYQWISIMGLWIMVFLFLGFPAAWDKGVAVVSGLIVVAIAYRGSVAGRSPKTAAPQQNQTPVFTPPTSSTFVENKNTF